ncbi:MAG TPA: hypothetical protein VLH12_08545 [Usitatibacter sp.]|nr:hypothetical protein [Usitatibacter sp.]
MDEDRVSREAQVARLPRSVWQEGDCPHGWDFDLHGDEMRHAGQLVPCSWCGGEHPAEDILQTYTVDEALDEFDRMKCPPLPRDADELRALRAWAGET